MTSILEAFEALLEADDMTVVEQIELPARAERLERIPKAFKGGAVGAWLASEPNTQKSLWRHQVLALDTIVKGLNIVLSTGTASGKTLIFQAAAIRMLEENPESRVIVFYPLKALAADQLVSWIRVVEATGLPKTTVMKVDGSVLEDKRREAVECARVLLMTPDVCHAWLMRNLANPAIKRFLARLDLVVIDEAHVLEAVFGSNFAFLFRCLQVARRYCLRTKNEFRPLQVIAASATIANPADHGEALTGLKFVAITTEDDGSPHQQRTLFHLACKVGDEHSFASSMQRKLLESSSDGSFITFVDSRQGVEKLVIKTELGELVRPYRSGYEVADRASIEEALRRGTLRGVVSTSALELGINIPHFAVGLNLGVPSSRKAFRQRIGRVGRSRPGAFAIIADPRAFTRFGATFREYYEGSVEPSHLYLMNRFMQFAHARCLAEEIEMLGVSGNKVPPGDVNWPEGFADIFEFAHLGGSRARPREFDHIFQIGGDAPHHNYPLRNVAEASFNIAHGGMPDKVGTLTLQQAIREAYPGALYLHLARGWHVYEWRSTALERSIRVSPSKSRAFTRPLIRTFVNLSIEPDGLVDGRFRKGPEGFLAECQLQITERVEGFEERGEKKLYKDLRQSNPAMTAKTRDFRTTGVVLRIEADWLKEKGLKQQLADALRDLLMREHSISPQDAGRAATNLAGVVDGQRLPINNALVIYDATLGSLRLTEPAYTEMGRFIEKLERAAQLALDDPNVLPARVIQNLKIWYEGLGPDSTEDFIGVFGGDSSRLDPQGWAWIYAAGSFVGVRDVQGVLRDVEVLGPELMEYGGSLQLFYRYRAKSGVKAMVPKDRIERIGDEWNMILWNPATGEFREHLDDQEGSADSEIEPRVES